MVIISFRPEEKLNENEAEVMGILNIPLVRIVKIDDVRAPDLKKFDGIAFTSSTSVGYFFDMYGEIDGKIMIFSIGDSTARELEKYITNPLVCSDSNSSGYASFIGRHNPRSVLIPRGETHSGVLNDELKKAGIYSENLYLYRYDDIDQRENIRKAVKDERTPLIFTSPLEVRLFRKYTNGRYIDNPVYPIGKTTFTALKDAGFTNIRFEGKKTFSELVKFMNSQ